LSLRRRPLPGHVTVAENRSWWRIDVSQLPKSSLLTVGESFIARGEKIDTLRSRSCRSVLRCQMAGKTSGSSEHFADHFAVVAQWNWPIEAVVER